MRLLLCITQAALDGPKSEVEWQDCQQLIQPSIRDYLEKWQPAFELLGDRERFLQVAKIAKIWRFKISIVDLGFGGGGQPKVHSLSRRLIFFAGA